MGVWATVWAGTHGLPARGYSNISGAKLPRCTSGFSRLQMAISCPMLAKLVNEEILQPIAIVSDKKVRSFGSLM